MVSMYRCALYSEIVACLLDALCLPNQHGTTTHKAHSCYRNTCSMCTVDLNLLWFGMPVFIWALVDSVDLAQYQSKGYTAADSMELTRSALACAYVSLCCVCFSSGFDDVVVDNFVLMIFVAPYVCLLCGSPLCVSYR